MSISSALSGQLMYQFSLYNFSKIFFDNLTIINSMTQDFKMFLIFFWIFPYYCLLLKSYHIILKLRAPIGFQKRFTESQINCSEKSLWFEMASTFSSRTSLMKFWFLPDFVVVFIDLRLVVMPCWSPKHDKHHHTPTEEYLSLFFYFSLNLLNFMAVKNLKIYFRISF